MGGCTALMGAALRVTAVQPRPGQSLRLYEDMWSRALGKSALGQSICAKSPAASFRVGWSRILRNFPALARQLIGSRQHPLAAPNAEASQQALPVACLSVFSQFFHIYRIYIYLKRLYKCETKDFYCDIFWRWRIQLVSPLRIYPITM